MQRRMAGREHQQGLEAADQQQPVILRLLQVVLERLLVLVLAEGREEATDLPPPSSLNPWVSMSKYPLCM